MHAAGALVLALSATFPNREGPAAAAELMGAVSAEWARGISALAQGTHPTVTYLVSSGAAGVAIGVASFGDSDSDDYEPIVDRDEVF